MSLKVIIAKTALLVVGAISLATAAVAGPYDKYKGTTLVVNFPAHPHYNAVMKVLPEFTKETGIKVEVDQLQYLTSLRFPVWKIAEIFGVSPRTVDRRMR